MGLSIGFSHVVPVAVATAIENFFTTEFFGLPKQVSGSQIDAVVSEFVATAQVRQGPAPSAEAMARIKQIIGKAVTANKPIPVLTPWGSKKTINGQGVDIAEAAALKQINSLQQRVTYYHRPGIRVNVRVDDISGFHLFSGQGDEMIDSCLRYCASLESICNILGFDQFIHIVRERSLFSQASFNELADRFIPIMIKYLRATEGMADQERTELKAEEELSRLGWIGGISQSQRDYYRQRLPKIYPGINAEAVEELVARFFAGVLARVRLSNSGAENSWGEDYVRLSFVPPVPGVPYRVSSALIHYRTMPTTLATTHMPAWRGKGYLRQQGQVAIPKLTSWHEKLPFQPASTTLYDGRRGTLIRSDYVSK